MSEFFIRRPIVAIVISVLMVIIGAITIVSLPVAQFPDIAPPEIRLQAIYPGADAETMEKAVATPIEQQINGVDNMDYMYSLNSTNNSSSTIMVDFDLKTDPNMDLILAQSRQQLANGQIPQQVNQIGIDVKKSLTSPMMLVALYSPKGTHDAKFLSNYGYINVKEPIARSYGVGQVQIYGIGEYAMRIWVKPDQLAKLGITVDDISNAVQSQNTVNPAGQVGGEPAATGQQFTYAVRAQGRLKTPEEFGDIVIRENSDGGVVRVKDVARVELGSQDYSWVTRLNGKPSAIIGIYQLPGSNAVEAAKGVRKLMAKMKESFPADIDYAITLDTTDAVRAGMHEIVQTLLEAFILVIIVVYVFLQDWRATIIPMFAVPVSLVATFAVFPLFGFSVNTLSLFGLVLAIGLVVDDAIVVVEGIQHHIEEGLTPKEAARKAMQELTGPVVGIALVLSAVFVPTVFIPGITGRLYQQFALTIAISVIISAFNALTLSPALGALFLRPKKESHGPLARFFGWFNRVFASGSNLYVRACNGLIRKTAVALALLAVFVVAGVFFGKVLPSSFLPDEDQGYMYVQMQLPEASSLEATSDAAREVEAVLKDTPGVQYTSTVMGFSLLSLTRTSYNAFFWVTLQPWEDRKQIEEQYQVIKAKLNLKLLTLPQGTVFAFSPPAISGVGTSGGFQFVLEDRAGKDPEFPGEQPEQVPRRRAQAARDRDDHHHVHSEHTAEVRVRGQGEGTEAGREAQRSLRHPSGLHGRPVRELLQRLWPRLASACGGRSALPLQPGLRRTVLCAQCQGRDGAAFGTDPVRDTLRAGIQDALQSILSGPDHRQCCAGLQLRPGDCRAGRGLPPDNAVGDGLRLHGHVAARAKGSRGHPNLGHLRGLAAVRLSYPRGAV